MFHYVVGGGIATVLGTNMINTVASTTVNTVLNTLSFAKNGTESNKMIIDINQRIEMLDIPNKLEVIKTMMTHDGKSDVQLALEHGVDDIIKKINIIMEQIEKEIKYHNSKWFSGYRSINLDDQIKELEILAKIIDSRISHLLQIKL